MFLKTENFRNRSGIIIITLESPPFFNHRNLDPQLKLPQPRTEANTVTNLILTVKLSVTRILSWGKIVLIRDNSESQGDGSGACCKVPREDWVGRRRVGENVTIKAGAFRSCWGTCRPPRGIWVTFQSLLGEETVGPWGARLAVCARSMEPELWCEHWGGILEVILLF